MPIEPRSTQTQIKHLILDRYLRAWGGIILYGLKGHAAKLRVSGRELNIHFVYVDCFSSTGRYSGDVVENRVVPSNETVFGSPIIGIRALDSLAEYAAQHLGIAVQTNAILIEERKSAYQELQASLEIAGLTSRVQQTERYSTLKNGHIALVRGDSTTMASALTNYTKGMSTYAFYLLDPYGPTGIPLHFVRQIISLQRHDVMINMIYQDLHKKIGIAEKMELSSVENKLLENYDAMFGHTRWRRVAESLDLAAILEEELGRSVQRKTLPARLNHAKDLEVELVLMYQDSLQSVDEQLIIKPIGLRFPDKERTMFYLYLTTHDPTGALKLNEVLAEAGYEEHELRERLKRQKEQITGQASMFDLLGIQLDEPAKAKATRPTTEEIAQVIVGIFKGTSVNRREVYKALVNETYFAPEVDAALKLLRKQKRASFSDTTLRNKTVITFASA